MHAIDNELSPLCQFSLFNNTFYNNTFYTDGVTHLDIPFSQLLGKPLIMVTGMIFSTVKASLVSAQAVLDSGYHI